MRISDWSSDVCSSDLRAPTGAHRPKSSPSGGDILSCRLTALAAYSAILAVCRERSGDGWSHVRIFAWWAVQGAAAGLSRQRLNEGLAVSRFHLPPVFLAVLRNIAPRLSFGVESDGVSVC